MKKISIILIGALLFILLAILCISIHVKNIEKKLTVQTKDILKEFGLNDVVVDIDGRDVILHGSVASEQDLKVAKNLLKNINGVRVVKNNLKVQPLEPLKETLSIDSTSIDTNFVRELEQLSVHFAVNSTNPNEHSISTLNKVVDILVKNPNLKIELSGHTDVSGSNAFNKKLSLQRAQKIKSIFLEKGIRADRLTVKGYGETRPLSNDLTTEAMNKNRRVEFSVIKEN